MAINLGENCMNNGIVNDNSKQKINNPSISSLQVKQNQQPNKTPPEKLKDSENNSGFPWYPDERKSNG